MKKNASIHRIQKMIDRLAASNGLKLKTNFIVSL